MDRSKLAEYAVVSVELVESIDENCICVTAAYGDYEESVFWDNAPYMTESEFMMSPSYDTMLCGALDRLWFAIMEEKKNGSQTKSSGSNRNSGVSNK